MFNFNQDKTNDQNANEKPTPKFQRFGNAGANEEGTVTLPFTEVGKYLPSKDHEIHYAACNISSDSSGEAPRKVESFASRERGTFLVMEPRDESLMRKAKVREILKTF